MLAYESRRHIATTGMPVLSDAEIDALAENLLADYKPELLEKPGRINALHFVESYLGAVVDYQDIYFNEGEAAILGATVFQNGYVRVFDRENMRAVPKEVHRGTILLDNSIMCDYRLGLQRFTTLHEGGHLYLHRQVFDRMCARSGDCFSESAICCRQTTIGATRIRRIRGEWTDEDFREHQANAFAAAIIMPPRTFVAMVQAFFREVGLKTECAYIGDTNFEFFYLPTLIWRICETYGVSRSAAVVQLKKRKLYVLKPKPKHDPLAFPY